MPKNLLSDAEVFGTDATTPTATSTPTLLSDAEVFGAAPEAPSSPRAQEYEQYKEAGGGYGSSLKRGLLRMAETVPALGYALSEHAFAFNPVVGVADEAAKLFDAPVPTPTRAMETGSLGLLSFLEDQVQSLPQNPTMARMARSASEADGVVDAVEAVGHEFAESPEKLQFLGETAVEQIPNLATSILLTRGAGGALKNVAMSEARRRMAAAAGGFGAGSAASTFGPNMAEGLEQGLAPEQALERASRKTVGQAVVDAATGALLPVKIGGSELVNIPAQAVLQTAGGAGGEAAGSLAAGEEVDVGAAVLEGLVELISAPGDVAGSVYATGARRIVGRATGKNPEDVTAEDVRSVDPEVILAEARREGLPIDEIIAQQTGTDRPAPVANPQDRRRRTRELRDTLNQPTVTRRTDIDPETGAVPEGAQPVVDPAGTGSVLSADDLAVRRQAVAAARRTLGREPTSDEVGIAENYLRAGEDPGSIANAFERGRAQQEGRLRDVPDMRAETARARTQEFARPAFEVAEARRARQDQVGGVDPQEGGRPSGVGPMEEFTFLDATINRGQMTAGTQVEDTGQVDEDGNVLVRYERDGETVEEYVEPERLVRRSRPVEPRRAQDFTSRAPRSPRGVPLERVTDRVGDDQRPVAAQAQPTPITAPTQQTAQAPEFERAARPVEPAPQPITAEDRRQDTEQRRRIDQMSPEEMRQALLTDDLTGLGNRRAYDEDPRKPVQVSADIDGLKWVNDNMSHDSGDQLLRAVGDALREEGANAYHPSGDEFWVQADSEAEARDVIARVEDRLRGAILEYTAPDGRVIRKRGIEFSYGIGRTLEDAEPGLQQQKAERRRVQRDAEGNAVGEPAGVEVIDAAVAGEPAAGRDAESDPAAEETPAGGVTSPSTGGTKFYSGLPVDVIAETLGKWMKGDAADWASTAERISVLADDIRKMVNTRGEDKPGRMGVITNLARTFLADTDANMRMLVKRYNSDTLRKLPDAFFARAGEGGVSATLDERVSGRLNHRLIDVDKIVKFLRANKINSKKDQQQIIRQVVTGVNGGGKMGEAVRMIRKFFSDELAYLRDAGISVGEAQNYFPRMLDSGALVNRRGKFIQIARGIYEARGMNNDAALAKAEAWWDNEVFGEGGTPAFQKGAGSATPSFLKPRELSEAESRKLRDAGFYVEDINAILGNYVMRATKRAEIARTTVQTADGQEIAFGENFANWDQIRQAIAKEDPDALEIMPEIEKLAAISAGVRNWNVGGKVQAASSWLRTWTTLATLEKATFASVGELVLAPVRGATGSIGDLGIMVRNLGTHFGALSRKALGLPQSERIKMAQELAEDIGAIAGEGHNAIMAARFAGGDPSGRVQSEVLAQFFRRIMLEQLTNYTRVTAVDNAGIFMRRLAKQMDGSAEAKKLNRPAFFLRELSIPAGREADFAKFVRKFGARLPSSAELAKAGEMGRMYKTALQRFTDQTVMRPSASTRPAWANHPIGAVLFQLQSFGYAFQKNVINRWGRIHAKGFKGEDGLSALDSAAMVFPMLAGMAMVTAMQAIIGEVRDDIYRPDRREETDAAKLEKALSRAGLFGIADPWIQAATGVRYQRSITEGLLGPALGSVGSAADTALAYSLNNSENTNTAERKVIREFYDFGVEPLAQLALTLAPASGLLGLAAKGASVFGLPMGRDEAVDAVAGPEEERSRQPRQGFSEMLFGEDDVGGGRRGGRTVERRGGRTAGRDPDR